MQEIEDLKEKIKEYRRTTVNLISMEVDKAKKDKEMSYFKSDLYKQANEATDEDGKKKYTNEKVRESFVNAKIYESQLFKELTNYNELIMTDKAELDVLKTEIRALRTIIEYKKELMKVGA